MKRILAFALIICAIHPVSAQYLVGKTRDSIVRYDLTTRDFALVAKLPFKLAYVDAIWHNTADIAGHRYFFKAVATAGADTIHMVRLETGVRTAYPVPPDHMQYPQYFNGSLYGLSTDGLERLDLNTGVITAIPLTVPLPFGTTRYGCGSSIRTSDSTYIYAPNHLTTPAIYEIKIATGAMQTHSFGYGYNGVYLNAAGRFMYYGYDPSGQGFLTYNFGTQAATMILPVTTPPNFISYTATAAEDPLTGRYFFSRAAPNFAPDTLYTFDVMANAVTRAALPRNNFMFYRFFDSAPVAAGSATVPESSLTAFPNPATDRLFIRGLPVSGTAPITFAVTDISGRRVLSGPLTASGVDISKLLPGSYFLVIHQQGGQTVLTFQR